MKPKVYHVGLVKDGTTVEVQLRTCIDNLSCELWKYMGQREITKAQVYKDRLKLLDAINEESGLTFTHIRVT